MSDIELVNNRWGSQTVDDQIRRLFAEDGTIYLVTGFFTYNAYHALRSEIEDFLSRNRDNELVIVVGPAADQFSPTIARELRSVDDGDQVHLYKYPNGFLHAKLYVRTGENPAVVIGSANLTQVAFRQNLELSAYVECDGPEDERLTVFLEWIDDLLEVCEPIRRRDLFKPIMMSKTLVNWANKGKLLPSRAVFAHRAVYLVLAYLVWLFLFA
ncbi:phospholipase D family protein [Natrarchaeobaculum aegyptiacum]|uniref:NgoFVII family restriction endonuclease n=1 Tax=Natrarchaeobaculum aegyptiacum TaxID=745377 RepID=A0A2Z2HXF1_9EURY|nr:phospholipase D family protein [Natrarchaeobaculum aegyptiacum]ARS91782.1 NgoFVII family restriction endonuclease [Natrarchaeobaculum aegyptiacum]